MQRLIKFTWFITALLFLGVLLWEYSYLPLNVGVLPGEDGETSGFISRENFFYIALAIFSFTNALLFGLRKLILRNMEQTGKRESAGRAGLKQDLSDWMLGFAASLNLFFMLGLIYLGVYNNSDGINLGHYGPVVYGGPVLVIILLGILMYILLKKRS